MTQVSPVQTIEQDSLYRKNAAYQGSIPFEHYLNSAQNQGDGKPNEVKLNPQIHQDIIQEIINNAPFAFGNLIFPGSINIFGLDQSFVSQINLSDLIDQIVQQVKLVKEHGKTELIIGLKSDNLGDMLLSVISRNGMISIQINASENSKKILDQNLASLEDALKKAHIHLDSLTVEATSSTSFGAG